MNRQSSLRQLNYSHILLSVGLVLSLLVVMFRPAGAGADAPKSVDVVVDGVPGSTKLEGIGRIDNIDYDVIYHGAKKPKTVGLSGIPLINILTKGGVKTDNVQFVKVQYGKPAGDGLMRIVPLNQAATDRPPILLEAGKKPGLGAFKVPSIVPGQPDPDKPIKEDSFLSTEDARLSFVPGEPGAKVLTVRVLSKKKKSGEYELTAVVNGASGGTLEYKWFTYDAKLNSVEGQHARSMVTSDATSGGANHTVTVVVTDRDTGSMGQAGIQYDSRKKSKGTTKNPYEPTPSTTNGSTTNGAGSGNGSGIGANGLGGGNLNTVPDQTPPPGLTQQVTPTAATSTPTPTDQTATASSAVDTTAITNSAQNVSGSGGLHTVSGVLLSAPSVAAAGSAGGTPISALPAPVVDQLNSIFQPVDSADQAWAYLLALLFAFTFSGAVREWVKP